MVTTPVRAEPPRDLHGRPDRGAARRAGENAAAGRQGPDGGEGLGVGHRDDLVNQLPVDDGVHRVHADPLHLVGARGAAAEDGAFGLHGHGVEAGEVLLEEAHGPREGAPRAAADDDGVQPALRLFEDLRTRGGGVGRRVGGVAELVHVDGPRRRPGDFPGALLRPLHPLLGGGEDQPGAQGPHHLLLLAGELLGDHENHLVTGSQARHCQGNARVAGGGLHHRSAGSERSRGLGGGDHRDPDAILDRGAGVEVLELGPHLAATFRLQGAQAQQRGFTDELQDRCHGLHDVPSPGISLVSPGHPLHVQRACAPSPARRPRAGRGARAGPSCPDAPRGNPARRGGKPAWSIVP